MAGPQRAAGVGRGAGSRGRAGLSALLPAAGLLFGTGLMLGAGTGEARADFRVCNGTSSMVGVAIGYRAEAGWTSEGWWRLEPTTCRSLIEGSLASRYYYLYAEDANGQFRWAGDINLCVAENEFKIAGVKECFQRGYQRMGFREYDTGEQDSWMVQLTDAARETTTEQQ